MEFSDLETILRVALEEFAKWLKQNQDWRGKEHECVNLFAHGFLAKQIQAGSVLYHLTQIGIEVAVPKPSFLGIKPAVRKDLVLWKDQYQTGWSVGYKIENIPIAIIEWKARKKIMSSHDQKWLMAFTRENPSCLGVAVLVNPGMSNTVLHASLVKKGTVTKDWIDL